MATIGVRELRQRASEVLRRVEAGERFEVTDRGRPVAMLAPISEDAPLARLRSTGEVIAARGDLDDLPKPIRLKPGQERPSAILQRLRQDER